MAKTKYYYYIKNGQIKHTTSKASVRDVITFFSSFDAASNALIKSCTKRYQAAIKAYHGELKRRRVELAKLTKDLMKITDPAVLSPKRDLESSIEKVQKLLVDNENKVEQIIAASKI